MLDQGLLLQAATLVADPVKDHHRVVHRIAGDGEQGHREQAIHLHPGYRAGVQGRGRTPGCDSNGLFRGKRACGGYRF
jgi:hypothetical protein